MGISDESSPVFFHVSCLTVIESSAIAYAIQIRQNDSSKASISVYFRTSPSPPCYRGVGHSIALFNVLEQVSPETACVVGEVDLGTEGLEFGNFGRGRSCWLLDRSNSDGLGAFWGGEKDSAAAFVVGGTRVGASEATEPSRGPFGLPRIDAGVTLARRSGRQCLSYMVIITVSKISFVQSVAAEQTSETAGTLGRGGRRWHDVCRAFEASAIFQDVWRCLSRGSGSSGSSRLGGVIFGGDRRRLFLYGGWQRWRDVGAFGQGAKLEIQRGQLESGGDASGRAVALSKGWHDGSTTDE